MKVLINKNFYGTVELLFSIVRQVYGIDQIYVRSKSRKREHVLPRQLFCWLACRHTDLSLKSIGKELEGRDHTTVIHSRNEIQEIVDQYTETPHRMSEDSKMIARTAIHLNNRLNRVRRDINIHS